MSEVLDCPCCDGRNASGSKVFTPMIEPDANGLWRVRCPCGVQTNWMGSRAAALGVWNVRPTPKANLASLQAYYNSLTDKSVPFSVLQSVWEAAVLSTKAQVPTGLNVTV